MQDASFLAVLLTLGYGELASSTGIDGLAFLYRH